jgi:hypothetical protein
MEWAAPSPGELVTVSGVPGSDVWAGLKVYVTHFSGHTDKRGLIQARCVEPVAGRSRYYGQMQLGETRGQDQWYFHVPACRVGHPCECPLCCECGKCEK